MSNPECTLRINGTEIPITDVSMSIQRELPDRVMCDGFEGNVPDVREHIQIDCRSPHEFEFKVEVGDDE